MLSLTNFMGKFSRFLNGFEQLPQSAGDGSAFAACDRVGAPEPKRNDRAQALTSCPVLRVKLSTLKIRKMTAHDAQTAIHSRLLMPSAWRGKCAKVSFEWVAVIINLGA
jgi:hypothetical protein